MASYQYVYHMDEVSKAYPGGKKVFENYRTCNYLTTCFDWFVPQYQ